MNDEGVVLPDPHAASLLGRETEPSIRRPRPRFRHYPGPVACTIVGLLFTALAAQGYLRGVARLSPEFYRSITYLAVIMFVMAAITFIVWLRFGVTISPRELGIAIVTGRKQTNLRYSDIHAITLFDRARYDERTLVAALTRTITIESTSGRTRAQYVALPLDELDPLLRRLIARIAAEPHPFSGDGWSIDSSTLEFRGERVPLARIAEAGLFDDEVRIWRRGEESPFLAIPKSSKNALVLLSLALRAAEQSLPTTTVAQNVAGDGSALGRLLFTRRTSTISIVWSTLLSYALLWVAQRAIDVFLPTFSRLGRGAILAIAVLATLYAIFRLTIRYRFHERGIIAATLLGNRTILYGAVASMICRATTTLVNGIPLGTTNVLTLAPHDGGKPLTIHLHRFRAIDKDLEPLRHAIAEHIARGLHERLLRGETIPWTKDATFTPAGVIVKTGMFGTGTETLPYDRRIGMFLNDGYLVLFRETVNQPLATLNAAHENFYPGLALFQTMMDDLQVVRRAV
ncbi:MAG TPA: hypothetical protein VHW00_02295 [Thermoanaerobaculia bacterium]|nr:hypothetical protein [Thermoanaerobaculia bacterium]